MTKLNSKIAKAGLGLIAGASMLLGAASAMAYTFNANLTVGSRGADVTALQTMLGVTPATGYFGNLTKAALKTWQAAHNVSPASGYFGPLTRAVANATGGTTTGGTTGMIPGCTGTTGYSPTTGQSCAGNTGTTTGQTGPVTAMLSTDNPASGYVIQGQATADLAHFTFNGTGTVTSVTLMRGGISDQNTLSNVYLYNGNTRLTDGFSFNNSGVLTMNGLNLMVNGTLTVAVKGDVASASGSTINIALTSYTVGGTATAVNLKGNDMYLGTGSLASVYMDPANQTVGESGGTLCTSSCPSVNAGTSAYTVWSDTAQVNTRAVWLKGANFRVVGSAPASALSNVKLYVDGVSTGAPATMTMINGSNYMMFDFSAAPVSLTTGSHTLDVRADIVSGASYTVQVSLQQAADLVLYDGQLNVNIAAQKSGAVTTFSPVNAGTITINAGTASVVVDPTFSSLSNITGGSTNTTIAKFKVHGYGEDVKVSTLSVTPLVKSATAGSCSTDSSGVTTAGTCGLNNLSVFFNGSQVGSSVTWTGSTDSPKSFSLGSQMILPAGADSIIEIKADLQTTGSVNYTAGTVSANLNVGASNAQGQTSHTTLNFPGGNVTGTVLTVQTGLLAVAKNTGYTNQNLNPNTANQRIASYSLQNQSSSESVRVTGLSFNLVRASDDTTALTGTGNLAGCPSTLATCYPALTNFSNLKTSETSGSGATPIQPAAANTFSVDFTLAPGATKTIDVYADTSSLSAGEAFGSNLVVTSVGSSSHVSVLQNGNGTAIVGQHMALTAGVVSSTPTLVTASTTTSQYIAAGDPMNTGTGATDATKAVFNLTSTGGSAALQELKFTMGGTAGAAQSVKVCIDNTTTCSAPALVIGGVAWIQNLATLTGFTVPNGGSGLTLDAFVTYAPVGSTGIAAGSTSSTTLTFIKYQAGGTTTTITPSVAAPTVTLVGSKPTLTVTQTTPASGLILGASNKVGEVTVTADAKGNIKLNDIKFNVGSANITTFALTSPFIADGTTQITGSSCGANATATTIVYCEFGTVGDSFATGTTVANTEINTDFDGYTISAGTSKVLSLYATVGGTITTGGGTTTVSTSVDQTGFNWDDTSTAGFAGNGVVASPSAGTNLSGSLIYGFPTNSYTIKQ